MFCLQFSVVGALSAAKMAMVRTEGGVLVCVFSLFFSSSSDLSFGTVSALRLSLNLCFSWFLFFCLPVMAGHQ